jgi:CRISPR-associated protein Cas5d
MTYPVMTPSAARGVLEAILWKPGMRWQVERIKIMKPVRLASFRRNEVNTKAPKPAAALVENGGVPPVCIATEVRAQRNTVALRNVEYIVEACIWMTDRAGPDDNLTKYVDMFQRRVERGQHFHQPYLGCREFAADVDPVEGDPKPLDLTRDLGIMLWDIDYSGKRNQPIFFAARLERGVLEVPSDPGATFSEQEAVS